MVMLRPGGKAYEIAKKVLVKKGVKVPKPKVKEVDKNLTGPYLYH